MRRTALQIPTNFDKATVTADGPLATACKLWTRSTNGTGVRYGQLRIAGKNVQAHRWAWTLAYGEIPVGLCVMHRCDTPLCVNIEHLQLGTPQDNNADCKAKGRTSRGSKHPKAKLSETEVLEIAERLRAGEGKVTIARSFNVTEALIRHIATGRRWSHLTGSVPA